MDEQKKGPLANENGEHDDNWNIWKPRYMWDTNTELIMKEKWLYKKKHRRKWANKSAMTREMSEIYKQWKRTYEKEINIHYKVKELAKANTTGGKKRNKEERKR